MWGHYDVLVEDLKPPTITKIIFLPIYFMVKLKVHYDKMAYPKKTTQPNTSRTCHNKHLA